MPARAVLFDLDQVLIDSRLVEVARRERRWGDVYKTIPRLPPYAGIAELLKKLSSRGISIAVVTSRPGRYCELIAKRWGWRVNACVNFGDCPQAKPSPEPVQLALKRLAVAPADAVLVGAYPADITAARKTGVYSVAALWGTSGDAHDSVLAACPDEHCGSVEELAALLTQRFAL